MARVNSVEARNLELAKEGKVLKFSAIKLRLDGTEQQNNYFLQAIGCVRFTYNFYLGEKQQVYKETGETLKYTEFKKSFNKLKDHPVFSWLKTPDKFALENAMMDVDTAFKNFFEGKSGYPVFKKKHSSKQSYTTNMTNNNIKLNAKERWVQLPKAGKVRIKMDKKQRKHLLENGLSGCIKSATVSRHSSGSFYVSLKIEEIVAIHPALSINDVNNDEIVGGDLGLTHFLILSDGTKIENPRYYRANLVKLAKMQRRLSKMKRGSQNYKKQQQKIAKLHLHIKNLRFDFLHKISRKLVNENQVIILEDLNVKGMIRNPKLSKSIQDVGWGYFKQFVQYKANWEGKRVILIDRFFPSSKLCSGCKEKKTFLSLNEREWVCPSCGAKHDRDENAATNIKNEGIRLLQEELAA